MGRLPLINKEDGGNKTWMKGGVRRLRPNSGREQSARLKKCTFVPS